MKRPDLFSFLPKSAKWSDVFFVAACLFAVLGFSNIFSLQGYLIVVVIVLLLTSEILYDSFFLETNFVLLLLFGLSYCFFSWLDGQFDFRLLVYFVAFPLAVYILGQQCRRKNDRRLLVFVVVCALGFFLSAIFLVVGTTLIAGIDLGKGQPLFSIFDLDAPVSRTGISLYIVPIFSLSLWTLLFWKGSEKKLSIWAKAISVLVIIIILYWSLFIGNRAPIVVFGLLILVFWLIKIFQSKNSVFRYASVVVITLAGICALLLVTGLVPDFIKRIPVFQRFILGGSDSARLNLYVQFFTNCWRYPFGGVYECIDDYWVHMFWLDIYTMTGIVPFALFSCLFVRTGYRYVMSQRVLRFARPSGNALFACLLSLFFLGLFEPLFSANSITLVFFAALFGYAPKRTIGKLPRWRVTI